MPAYTNFELIEKIEEIRRLRAKWTEELVTGELNQWSGRLANYDYTAFCCLGVAEEVLGSKFNIERSKDTPGFYDELDAKGIVFSKAESVLHDSLKLALGLSDEQQSILIAANDSGAAFDIIAAIIQEMNIWFEGTEYHSTGTPIKH